METVFILLVVVLVLLAISDLVVGVSNDAVNFLNSAIGSKAAPFWIIMAVASLGVVFGATFSSGMMEVARKGIFHPEMFSFTNIMIIFLAVMLTDIILLDTFNTLGLPTSTTVSIVFELLGAAVSVAMLKIIHSNDQSLSDMGAYINSGKALVIIAGILLSVVVAFSIGALVQYIVRLVFSFNYQKTFKYWGALWGGIAITAITYFILIKGAKGASFMTDDMKHWIKDNTWTIVIVSFTAWTILLKLMEVFTKINILKMIILVGTFALAMAFAGNDLVNFIGVPLAGLKSYQAWHLTTANPDDFLMVVLSEKVKTPTLYLLIAGLVMIITLWFSKKARSVTKTTIDLSKQDVGAEKFESSLFSRFIVRQSIKVSNAFKYITPAPIRESISKRFEFVQNKQDADSGSFDLIRASVNLVVASILISFATSLKLPLSTTYVTFMVAMGTSLADGAWGRESAVYRVNGVITVIGGWFFTAFIAFTVSFMVALSIFYLGFVLVPVYLIIAVFILIKSKSVHKQRTEDEESIDTENLNGKIDILEACSINVSNTLNQVSEIYGKAVKLIAAEDRVGLKKLNKKVEKINERAKALKDGIEATIHELQEDSIETGHYYVQVLDYLREIAHDIAFIVRPTYQHFDNQHSGFNEKQIEELNKLKDLLQNLLDEILDIINNNHFDDIEKALEYQQNILIAINKFRKNQVKRIKDSDSSTKNSLLYLGILNETKNMVLHIVNLLKSQRDFIIYQNS
jgi:phosphate/sulfate permease